MLFNPCTLHILMLWLVMPRTVPVLSVYTGLDLDAVPTV